MTESTASERYFENGKNKVRKELEITVEKLKLWQQCKECDRRFTSDVRLNHHIQLKHINVKNLRCKFCKASFKLKSKLWKHHRKSHSDKDHTENIEIEIKKIPLPEAKKGIKVEKEEDQRSIFHSIELLSVSDGK